MMNTIDPRQTSAATDYMNIPNAAGIPSIATDLLYRGPTVIPSTPFDPSRLQPVYPKNAKEFLERKVKELRDLIGGLKSQLVNAENELYEHEKDLNKLVSQS